jgi:hypothetical protein
MLPHSAEESLHTYLRRHYDKVSQKRAGQFVEQKEAEVKLVLTSPAVEVSGS